MTADFLVFWSLWLKNKNEKCNEPNKSYLILMKKTDIFYHPIGILQRAYIGSVRPSLYTLALTGATGATRQAVQGRKILLEYGKLKSKQLFWALLPEHSDLKLRTPFENVMVTTKHLSCAEFDWLSYLTNLLDIWLFPN